LLPKTESKWRPFLLAQQPFGSRCGISASQQFYQDQTCRDERKDDGDPPARFACGRPRLIPGGNGKNNGKNQEEKCDGQRDSHDRRNGWAGVIVTE
jgi:hypothetical protein